MSSINPEFPGLTAEDFMARQLEIAAQYLPVGEVSQLKAGLLGYITAVHADIFQNSNLRRMSSEREFFLNTARKSSSIYQKAKETDFEPPSARPARIRAGLYVAKSDLIRYSDEQPDGTRTLLFPRSEPVTVGSFKFMLPRSISVVLYPRAGVPGNYTVRAFWVQEDTSIPAPQGAYVRSWTEPTPAGDRVYLDAELLQLELQEYSQVVLAADQNSNLFYTVGLGGKQYAYMDVLYEAQGSTVVLPKFFNDLIRPENTSQYCYYGFPGPDTAQAYFQSTPESFRPAYNSRVVLRAYVTEGAKASFEYSGPVGYRFPRSSRAAQMPVGGVAEGATYGGLDAPDLLAFKRLLIAHNLSKDSLVNEIDFNNFYEELSRSSSVYGSRLKFVKVRDDIIRRVVRAYALLRGSRLRPDGTSETHLVPTDTVDLRVSLEDLIQAPRGGLLAAGETVVLDETTTPGTPFHRLAEVNEDLTGKLAYALPYAIEYRRTPVPRVSYLASLVNRVFPMLQVQADVRADAEVIAQDLLLVRDVAEDKAYRLSVSMAVSVRDPVLLDGLVVRALLTSGDGPGRTVYGYVPLTVAASSDGNLLCTAEIKTSDSYDSRGWISAVDSVWSLQTNTRVPLTYLPSHFRVEVAVLSDSLSPDTAKYREYEDMPDMEDYSTVAVYACQDMMSLSRPLTRVMRSDFSVDNVSSVMTIKAVPVVEKTYLSNPVNAAQLARTLSSYERAIEDNELLTEGNTQVELKFFKTYGRTPRTSTGSAHCYWELRLKARGGLAPEAVAGIRSVFTEALEAANEAPFGQKVVAFSNLASRIETAYPSVAFLEFVSLSGTAEQKLLLEEPDPALVTPQELDGEIPTWVNVAAAPGAYSSPEGTFAPDVRIVFLS